MPFAFILLMLHVAAPGVGGWTLDENSRLQLRGTSTVHDYAATAELMTLSVNAPTEPGHDLTYWLAHANALAPTLRIEVARLRSGSDGLDENMQAALKAPDKPQIVFTVDSCEATQNSAAPQDAVV